MHPSLKNEPPLWWRASSTTRLSKRPLSRPFLRKFLRSRNRSKFVKFLLLQWKSKPEPQWSLRRLTVTVWKHLLILSGTSSPAEKVRIRTVPSALSARIWIIALGKERTLRFAAKTADCLRPVFPTHPVHWPACSKLFEWSSTTTSRQRERCFSLPRSGRRQKGTCAAWNESSTALASMWTAFWSWTAPTPEDCSTDPWDLNATRLSAAVPAVTAIWILVSIRAPLRHCAEPALCLPTSRFRPNPKRLLH